MRGWGGFLAGCQLPAAALQHVNMSVARETGRAHTATRAQKPLSSRSDFKRSEKIQALEGALAQTAPIRIQTPSFLANESPSPAAMAGNYG